MALFHAASPGYVPYTADHLHTASTSLTNLITQLKHRQRPVKGKEAASP
jgi:hypothetical protein